MPEWHLRVGGAVRDLERLRRRPVRLERGHEHDGSAVQSLRGRDIQHGCERDELHGVDDVQRGAICLERGHDGERPAVHGLHVRNLQHDDERDDVYELRSGDVLGGGGK